MRGSSCILGALIATSAARADFVPGNIYTTKTAYECGAAPERIYEFNPATQQWRLFAELGGCWINGLTFTPDGKLRASMYAGSAILEFESDGSWKTVLGKGDGISWPLGYNGVTYASNGDFYVLNTGADSAIMKYPKGSAPGRMFANLSTGGLPLNGGPGPLASAPDGSLYYNPPGYGSNQSPAAIVRFAPDGTMSLFDILAGNNIGSLIVDSRGTLYVLSGLGVYRYVDGDPAKKQFVTLAPFDSQWAVALSPDETLLYTAAGQTVIELSTGKTWTNPSPPPQPLGGGWGWGLAVYVPETSSVALLLVAITVSRLMRR